MTVSRRVIASSILFALAAACSGDGGTTVDSADGELEEPRRKGPPYQVAAVSQSGTITGTVSLAAAAAPAAAAPGAAPAAAPAAAAPANADTAACAEAAPSPSDIVVYLEDIASGRALPDTTPRRHELAVTRCDIQPRVLIATAGGTLNLSNALGQVHRVSFTFEGMKNPMLRIPFSDPGQLVPTEKVLAVPGQVTVASDQGPGVVAQILIVEHPYSARATNGSFTLDSVPPGTYSLVALSATGRAEAKVQVQAGAATNVVLTVP